MSTLTNEQIQTYIDNDGDYCPFCGLTELRNCSTDSSLDVDQLRCVNCGETWGEISGLVGIYTEDQHTVGKVHI